MQAKKMNKIGILAYGSLIDNPGKEIESLIIDRIECTTPFKVEYARKSKKRDFGPTLIPTENIGKKVKAVILVLKDETDLNLAKSILWRRETGNNDKNEEYTHSDNPTLNKVQVNIISKLNTVETVLYTSIGKNIEGDINPKKLSDLALKSILKDAGKKGEDGVQYLLDNKKNGIVTEFSEQYEKLILKKTECDSLEDVITKMVDNRNND